QGLTNKEQGGIVIVKEASCPIEHSHEY
ncbi:MAG: hypothetical protein JWQ02_1309, partial [Capsulimonas sp.]|nr:hypothetical protein [Capsulimonas sp.]